MPAGKSIRDGTIQGIEFICRIMDHIATAIVALLAFPICYDVIARSLGYPTIWVFETTLYALGASAFLANATTLKTGAHFRITLLGKVLPRFRPYLDGFALLVTLAFGLLLLVAGTGYAWESFSRGIESATLLSVPLYIPQSEIALGGFALTLQSVAILLSGEGMAAVRVDLEGGL